jgi:hypothetical protein
MYLYLVSERYQLLARLPAAAARFSLSSLTVVPVPVLVAMSLAMRRLKQETKNQNWT